MPQNKKEFDDKMWDNIIFSEVVSPNKKKKKRKPQSAHT